MERSAVKRKTGIRQLVIIGMLSGISIFLGVTGLGFIRLPLLNATIMHLPVIIGAILEGPIVGMAVGLCFGLFSMYQAMTAPTLTSFVFLNPIIALIPRVLIGVVSYYTYKFLEKKFKKISIAGSAIAGTLTNTVLVLSLIYVLYAERYATVLGKDPSTAGAFIASVGAINGIPEVIVSVLLTVPVVMTIKKIQKRL